MPETSDTEALRKQVEERAYALWESEGRPHGHHLDHWCKAESEIMSAGNGASGSSSPDPATTPANNKKKAADAKV